MIDDAELERLGRLYRMCDLWNACPQYDGTGGVKRELREAVPTLIAGLRAARKEIARLEEADRGDKT